MDEVAVTKRPYISGKMTDVSRAIHTADGILKGIACDNEINAKELLSLQEWLKMHKSLSNIFPLCDIYDFVNRIHKGRSITESEKIELLEFCNLFQSDNDPYDLVTNEMRHLHGFIQGICSDGKVTLAEFKALEKWMLYHESNKDKWPFMEIYSAVEQILKDGIVSAKEQKDFIDKMKSFYSDDEVKGKKDKTIFVEAWMQSSSPTVKTIDQIIDTTAEISIKDKTFCFTGQMENGSRRIVARKLIDKGGIPVDDVSHSTNYLVIGSLSNPCWAYATYGRKIEKVMNKFKNTKIIGEKEFINTLDAL